jgi:hypothetical protein
VKFGKALLPLHSYPRWGDVVFDDAVEVDAAALQEWGGGAVVEEVPGFSVMLPLVLFVAGEDSDAIVVGRHRGRNDIPDVFRNAVDSQVIEIGFLVITPGQRMRYGAGDRIGRASCRDRVKGRV